MTLKKGSLLLLQLVFAGILFWVVHLFFGKRNTAAEENVARSNALRREHSVPIIEVDWIKQSISPEREKWDDGIRGINSSTPLHLYKEIIRGADTWEEEDAFHFEFSDSLQYRLILYHEYSRDNTSPRRKNKLIIYEPGNFPPTYSKNLTRDAADSILQVWKIKI